MLQTPELMVKNMLRPILVLLAASNMWGDEELRVKLTAMARRLYLTDMLLRQWTIAVGGAQGAGKTTLILELYGQTVDLEPWLPTSGGRDETMPILLVEDNTVIKPQGFLRKANILGLVDEPVDAETFKSAARRGGADCLLPVLRLPSTCLASDGDALLLLPGYETAHDENNEWQMLMRQAMVGASAGVVVADETLLAADTELTILRDMQTAGVEPIVVISRTEATPPERRGKLQATAADLFKISTESVICTGIGADYRDEWVPRLIDALKTARNSPARVRKAQLMHLETLLRDLREVLDEAQGGLALHDVKGAQEAKQALKMLGIFDDSVEKLKKSYKKTLNRELDSHFKEAAEELENRLIKNHDGWLNKIKAWPNTAGEDQRRLRQDIEAAWEKPGACGDLNADVMAQVTFKALGGPLEGLVPLTAQTKLPQRLGYTNTEGAVTTWKGGGEGTTRALRYLLGNDAQGSVTKEELHSAVLELPALALEFCRYVQLMPEKLRVDIDTRRPTMNPVEAMREAGEHFSALAGVKSDIIKTVGVVLGVAGADEEIDSLPALFKALGRPGEEAKAAAAANNAAAQASASPWGTIRTFFSSAMPAATLATGAGAETAAVAVGFGTAMATGAAALAAAGLIYLGIDMVIRRADADKSNFARTVLIQIRDGHSAHYMTHLEEEMLMVREYFKAKLEERYGLTPDLLSGDRVARALAELKALRSEMHEALTPRVLVYSA